MQLFPGLVTKVVQRWKPLTIVHPTTQEEKSSEKPNNSKRKKLMPLDRVDTFDYLNYCED